MIGRPLLVACCLLAWQTGHAGAIDRLHQFFESTRTVRAEFTQTVFARNGRTSQTASGNMMLSRPGKFRWQIEKPYSQLLIGDGERVWIYDPDLRQVTIRKIGAALGGTPAALLAGESTIEKNFALREAGDSNGLQWIEAIPKSPDSGFEKVRLGFAGSDLKAMELLDSLGQTTSLRFARLERNPRLAPALFQFTPPANADVVGE